MPEAPLATVTGTLPRADDPLWYKDAVIYQLHPKSFFDGNNDGVGDFRGMLEKLDYIAELGVTAIWMLPFYPSPRKDDGYDIADYRGVHEEYGTLADLRRFIDEAHARGLKVITELVVNHTSDQHPWFQRARRAPPGSPERDFYVWSDDDKRYSGTRIIFLDTEKSNWTWDEEAKAYFWHRFYAHQPDLNFDNPAVLDEVLSVMRFWLDMGIDGLRLDAVPYLVEREGTNNENLPETHAILKRIRAELDIHAPGRMLLAEANQWPEDAQQYFGESDECHMAFHFPLMPRMYMAIAREDRFPVTDIMRQTPAIPSTCQWAIFLRNHDELTLEMVTSSERDYLWETYASDRRARINLGIRRRLAPLLQRDRRRIELMNGLLLSMPGTPVIYYGDEIAMGDNIHLGDRDGVRTPMQWSVDRNGGFSRADPAALVLPPIMDPIYGFQAVNVEAQEHDPHSLLNWMRTMLSVRARHRAFGRGTQRFLYPENRKILAYLREYQDRDTTETILCVNNLSRTAQAVELTLSGFVGRVPVDLIGGSAFPPIGQLPYLLTLPPYAFYWFILERAESLTSAPTGAVTQMPDLATIVVRRELEEVMQPTGRAILEREALPAYLPKRRWFAAKGEAVRDIRVLYAAKLGGGAEATLFTEIGVELEGRSETYALPLGACREEDRCDPLATQLAIARVRRAAQVGILTDAFALDAFVQNVMVSLAARAEIPVEGGRLVFRPAPGLAAAGVSEPHDIRRLSAEQSNSSLILNERVVLKVIRKVLAGVHPEAEMTGYLTERGFANVAPLMGEVVRIDTAGVPHTVMLAQGFVHNQGDAWSWTLDYLQRAGAEYGAADDPEAAVDALDAYNAFAANIGRRLAEMHAVLAADTDRAEFKPQEADDQVRAHWAEEAIAQIDLALAAVARVTSWPDEAVEQLARRFTARADALRTLVRRLARDAGAGALATRVHGDFHLGQVLVTTGDATIVDFEGEPAKTMEQRRARSSPVRDMAGLIRSFDYATATAQQGRATGTEQAASRRARFVETFRRAATRAFTVGYRAVLADAPRRWVSEAGEQPLLDLFLIEKAVYEIRYEAANRPAWIGIPLAGLGRIMDRLMPAEK